MNIQRKPPPLILDDSWRALNKLRARVAREEVDLFAAFNERDTDRIGLCSEARFAATLSSGIESGLSIREIGELADRFRIQDGRIDYGQMCGLVHSFTPEMEGKPTPVLKPIDDWEKETEPNRLSQAEEKHVLLLLNKFAAELRTRDTIQRPYFQDYEIAFKPDSKCTLAHFARAIASRGFKISPGEFSLLARRFARGPHLVSYAAFAKALDDAMRDMDEKGNYLLGGEVVEKFPGKLDDINLPVFPRVQTDHTKACSVFTCDPKKVFHESLNAERVHKLVLSAIKKLQRHVKLNNLKVCAYFYPEADPMQRGQCSQSYFRLALERLLCGPESKQRCYVCPQEMEHIIMQYRDPTDESRVCWDVFTDDLNKVFEDTKAEKPQEIHAEEKIGVEEDEEFDIPKKVVYPWELPEPIPEPGWFQVVKRVLLVTKRRGLSFDLVKRPFNHYDDRANPDGANGHVTRNQMRQCFLDLGILLSASELASLEEHYNDSISFNYFAFINDLMNEELEQEAYKRQVEINKKTEANFYFEEERKRAQSEEQKANDVISVMGKIKFKSINMRVPVTQKIREFVKNSSSNRMTEEEFYTIIQSCNFSLTPFEMTTLLKAFSYPDCSKTVKYAKFCALLDEVEAAECKATTLEKKQVVEQDKQWLNFEQRHIFSMAIQKLADFKFFIKHLTIFEPAFHRGDINPRFYRCFRVYDMENCGSVTRNHFTRVLASCGLLDALSTREIDEIARCFRAKPKQPGLLTHANCCEVDTCSVDYIALLRALEILHATKKFNPFKM